MAEIVYNLAMTQEQSDELTRVMRVAEYEAASRQEYERENNLCYLRKQIEGQYYKHFLST
jgi:hypothetical protein